MGIVIDFFDFSITVTIGLMNEITTFIIYILRNTHQKAMS